MVRRVYAAIYSPMSEHDKLTMVVRQAEDHLRERQLAEACRLARVGMRTIQSRERSADTARRRAVVAWILWTAADWRQAEIAQRLGVTKRQVIRMVHKE